MKLWLLLLLVFGALPGRPLVLQRGDIERARLFPGIWELRAALVPGPADPDLVVSLLHSDGSLTDIPVTAREASIIRSLSESGLADAPVLDSFWLRMRLRARAARTTRREHRVMMANRGMWVGAAGGGYAAARTSVHYLGSTRGCSNTEFHHYRVDHPAYWLISGGATALGAGAGCVTGTRMDRRPAGLVLPEPESGRIGWAIGGAILGSLTGVVFLAYTGSTLFGRIRQPAVVENDPHELTPIPAAIAAVGLTAEIGYLGFLLGRTLDRRQARRLAAEVDDRLQALLDDRPGPR